MGLTDCNGTTSVRQFSHVKVANPHHARWAQTGTVVRLDLQTRRVWVMFPDGQVIRMASRSVQVLASKRAA